MWNVKHEAIAPSEFIIVIFLRPFFDFFEIQFAAAGQLVFARIVQDNSLAFYLRFEIVRF